MTSVPGARPSRARFAKVLDAGDLFGAAGGLTGWLIVFLAEIGPGDDGWVIFGLWALLAVSTYVYHYARNRSKDLPLLAMVVVDALGLAVTWVLAVLIGIQTIRSGGELVLSRSIVGLARIFRSGV